MASDEDEHMRCRRLVEAANAAGGADNVTVLLARLIIKEHVRPEAPSEQPVRTVLPPEHKPEAKAPRGSLTAPSLLYGSSRNTIPSTTPHTTPAVPASEPAKPPIWRREIRWPWGHKTTSPTALHTPKSEPAGALAPAHDAGQEAHAPAKPGNVTSMTSWDPRVLKAVEESLAAHIGPVAKILVGRAAHHTKDLRELCLALAAQLSTEQERKSFLHHTLHQK